MDTLYLCAVTATQNCVGRRSRNAAYTSHHTSRYLQHCVQPLYLGLYYEA